jgi:LysR family tcuABC transcriptional regulator
VIADVAHELAVAGRWPGTTLHDLNTGGDEP